MGSKSKAGGEIPRTKIFGIGWAKTGTTTLCHCLQTLGYDHQGPALHLVDDLATGTLNRIIALAARSESFDDWPWPLLYRELHRAFPDSKFILTRRDPGSWLTSYRNMLGQEPPPDADLLRQRRIIYDLPFPNVTDDALLRRYTRHNQEVESYFQQHLDKFLIVDWERGDGWPKLCAFLGLDPPDLPFPHANQGTYRLPTAAPPQEPDRAFPEESAPEKSSQLHHLSSLRRFFEYAVAHCGEGSSMIHLGSPDPSILNAFPSIVLGDHNTDPPHPKFAFLWMDPADASLDQLLHYWTPKIQPGGILAGNGLTQEPRILQSLEHHFQVVHSEDDCWIVRIPNDQLDESQIEPIPMSQALESLLGTQRSVRYAANPGNTGDAVIARATGDVFGRLGIKIEPESDIFLAGGGGNLVPRYDNMRHILEKLPRSGMKTIILPSTVIGCFDLLREFDDITLLARERITWRLAREEELSTVLCHDVAFEIDYQPWTNCPDRNSAPLLRNFRTDSESTSPPQRHQQSNLDISLAFGNGDWTIETARTASNKFISKINRYCKIETDRLHVAIVAACLGKNVQFYPNDYHKNRSVYRNSLTGFPNVTFEET